jgi:hypothetical protein
MIMNWLYQSALWLWGNWAGWRRRRASRNVTIAFHRLKDPRDLEVNHRLHEQYLAWAELIAPDPIARPFLEQLHIEEIKARVRSEAIEIINSPAYYFEVPWVPSDTRFGFVKRVVDSSDRRVLEVVLVAVILRPTTTSAGSPGQMRGQ